MRKIVARIFTVSFLTLISRIFGLIRDMMISRYLGAGMVSDAFITALKIPNMFRSIFAEGAINVSFIPIFTKISKDSKQKSLEFTANICSILLLSLLIITFLVEIFMPYFVTIIAFGFRNEEEKFLLSISLSRITFFYLILIALASFLSSLLNTINKFFISSAVPIILNISMIFAVLIANHLSLNIAYILSYSVVIAGLLQLAWVLVFAIKYRLFVMPKIPKFTSEVKNFFKNFFPSVMSGGILHLNIFVDTIIASFIPSAVTYIYYADRINQFPLAMVGIAISTVLLPSVSSKIADGEDYEELQNNSIILGLFFGIPAAFGILAISFKIVEVLFVSGEFTTDDGKFVSYALMIYSLVLPAFIVTKIILSVFFARGDTKTPMRISAYCFCINLVLNIIFAIFIGYLGIILATLIASYINLMMLVYQAKKRGYYQFRSKFFTNKISKIIAGSITMFTAIYYIGKFLESSGGFISLIGMIISGILVYGTVSIILLRSEIKVFLRH